jgi:hypothetical protein
MPALRTLWPVLTVACGLFLWNVLDVHYVQDDAYITLVHARNLVEGHGPVFNPGERVEGYTSPLWMLLSAAVLLATSSPIAVLQWIGIGCGLAIVVMIVTWTWHELSDEPEPTRRLLAGAAGCLVALLPSFAYWCGSGMETGVFLAVVVAALLAIIYRPTTMLWSWLTALALVIRPESMMLFAVLAAWHVARTRSVVATLPPLITLTALTVWRLAYYGAWLPNTFAAKTPGMDVQLADGLLYLVQFLEHVWIWGIGLMMVAVGIRYRRSPGIVLVGVVAGLWLIAITLLGGDVLRHQRFLLPVFVLTVPLFTLGVRSIAQRIPSAAWFAVACVGVTAVYNGYSERTAIHQSIDVEGKLVSKMSRTGIALRSIADAQRRPLTIAASTIGALTWTSKGTVIDMLGLTDRTIATQPDIIAAISATPGLAWKERKYNARYVLNRAPDYIVFSTGIKPSAYAERALLAEGMFVEYYQYYIPVPGSTDMQLVFRRKPREVLRRITKPQREELLANTSWIAEYALALNALRDVSTRGQALLRLEQLAPTVPSSCSWVHQQLGDAAFDRGRHDEAFAWYTEAIRRDPCDIRSHFGMFQLARLRKDVDAARLHGDWVTRCNPKLFTLLGIDVPVNVY